MKAVEVVGKRFGKLFVIRRVEDGGPFARYLCICDCGSQREIRGVSLKNGDTVSCGCRMRSTGFENRKNEVAPTKTRWEGYGQPHVVLPLWRKRELLEERNVMREIGSLIHKLKRTRADGHDSR